MKYCFSFPQIHNFETSYYFQCETKLYDARSFPNHFEDKIEFYILFEGDASFAVESSVYKISAGDIIVTKPNEIHNCILNSYSLHKHACFWFDCSSDFLFGDFLAHDFGKDNLITPSPQNKERLLVIYDEIQRATKENDKHKILYLELEMLDIFRKSLTSASPQKTLPPLLRQILDYIDLNFKSLSPTSALADKFFISQSTLIRLFKKHLHTTPKQYVETKRLFYSRRLLKSGASVLSACLESGFTDCSNYIRLFKKHFSITPKQYRND